MKRTLQKHASSASPQLDSKSTTCIRKRARKARRPKRNRVNPPRESTCRDKRLEPRSTHRRACGASARARIRPACARASARHHAFAQVARSRLLLRAPAKPFLESDGGTVQRPRPQDDEDKTGLLHEHGIALWDVLAECTIEGASDGTIAECVPNDIAWLLGKAPVDGCFARARKRPSSTGKYCEPATHMPCTQLPSTSPANAAASLDKLIEAYRVILPHCR